MSNFEIELKVIISDHEKFVSWLKKYAKFVGSSRQIDTYFNPPHTNFIFFDELGQKRANDYLRIRVNPKNGLVAFKRHHPDPKGGRGYIDEYETEISDSKQMQKIFELLSFKKISTVDKLRQSYEYKDFQIECDTVKGLGYFVEVELKSKVRKPEMGYKKITGLLDEIGIDWKEVRGGYLQMMWNKDYR